MDHRIRVREIMRAQESRNWLISVKRGYAYVDGRGLLRIVELSRQVREVPDRRWKRVTDKSDPFGKLVILPV